MMWLVALALVAFVFFKLGSKSVVPPAPAVAPVPPDEERAEREAISARVEELYARTTKIVELQNEQLMAALVPLRLEVERRKAAVAALVGQPDAVEWVPLPDIELVVFTRALDQLREFGCFMAEMVMSSREDIAPLAQELAFTAYSGFCVVTTTIREARNYVCAFDQFAISETLVELWAVARKAFGPELPGATWFGQKD